MDGAAAPAGERIEALDVVRGAALFGILLLNITGFGLPDAYDNPRNAGGAEGLNLWAWIITQVGFEGTQRGLFSILYGAGAVLLTARLEAAGRTDAADIYMRRNLWLIAFGMVNAFLLLWFGDILYAYGVTGLFIFAFRKLPARWLIIFGAAALALGAAWNIKDNLAVLAAHDAAAAARVVEARGGALTDAQHNAIGDWRDKEEQVNARPETTEAQVAAMRGGYASAFTYVAAFSSYWQSWGLYRYFFDIFGMMLIGMGLYKLGVLTLKLRTGTYVAMAIAGYGIGLVVNMLEVRHIMAGDFGALAFSEASMSYDIGRLAMTMGHLSALLLFVRSGTLGWLRKGLAAVGKMALTSYLTHSAVCAIFFIGMGWYGQLERYQLYYVVAAISLTQLIVSPLWLRFFRFGPIEWLWRWLTYLERPAMRRA